jgi:hypothetical protein
MVSWKDQIHELEVDQATMSAIEEDYKNNSLVLTTVDRQVFETLATYSDDMHLYGTYKNLFGKEVPWSSDDYVIETYEHVGDKTVLALWRKTNRTGRSIAFTMDDALSWIDRNMKDTSSDVNGSVALVNNAYNEGLQAMWQELNRLFGPE